MELGFVEEIIAGGASEVPGTSFASKVGGKPVWPELKGLPGSLQCKKCSKPLTFLLQFHAPLSSSSSYSSSSSGSSSLDEDSEDDPRMLLVFMCKSSSCHTPGDASCFTVLRYEGSNEDMVATHRDNIEDACEDIVAPSSGASDVKSVKQSVSTPSPLCVVCGCYGPKQCGGCRKVSYCSREHQVHDWTSGHKKTCSELSESPDNSALPASCNPSRNVCGVLLPEWDLVTEPEPASCLKEHEERSEQERMADYERYVTERGVVCEGAGLSGEALEKAAAEMEGKKDKYFRNFMKRIAPERQQVLRYERGGQELFISKEHVPTDKDIPECKCGASRVFELQIMPQLLYYLKLDSAHSGPAHSNDIDWGTLLIYTCGAGSCKLGRGYHTEFLWKQEVS